MKLKTNLDSKIEIIHYHIWKLSFSLLIQSFSFVHHVIFMCIRNIIIIQKYFIVKITLFYKTLNNYRITRVLTAFIAYSITYIFVELMNLKEYRELILVFQDIHVMVFIGFGFLMTFLKRYAFSSLGFNFLLGAIMVQWSILCLGFYNLNEHQQIPINLKR